MITDVNVEKLALIISERDTLLARVKELEVALSDISKMCGEARAEADLLLNRVKELEVEKHAAQSELMSAIEDRDARQGERDEALWKLHQRDTALNAAREALESSRNTLRGSKTFMADYLIGRTHPGVSRLVGDCRDDMEQIDHALSQIQAITPTKT